MAKVARYAAGRWCWMDLATPDPEAAKAFYGDLFGWEFHDMPASPGETYTFVRLGGDDLGGIYRQPTAEREAGRPAHWVLYVAVDDADATLARAAELGGQVSGGACDVGSAGRSAMLADPQGAGFALWQAKDHAGAGRFGETGAMGWAELLTPDPGAAGEFYSGLFGWGRKDSTPPPVRYVEWTDGDTSIGGMMAIPEEWGPVPPHWIHYLMVADCDATVARAGELGGEVRVPPTDIADVGRFAYLADPQGAVFAVITLAG